MELSPGAQAHGPALVRLLARVAGLDTPAPAQAVSGRLGEWIDWRHAVALAAALDARPAMEAGTAAATGDDGACAQVRTMLVGAIDGDRAFAAAGAGTGPAAATAAAPDAAFFRQRYLALQQKMEAEAGHLRGRLRNRLMQRGGDAGRLAAIDAVIERALGPRERALLAPIPELLETHFERLRGTANAAAAGAATTAVSHAATPWLDAFRLDMRQLLRAELDLRLQPAEGLLAALRTAKAESDAR